MTNIFMLAGAVYDRAVHGRAHWVYWSGIDLALAVEALVWPFPRHANRASRQLGAGDNRAASELSLLKWTLGECPLTGQT